VLTTKRGKRGREGHRRVHPETPADKGPWSRGVRWVLHAPFGGPEKVIFSFSDSTHKRKRKKKCKGKNRLLKVVQKKPVLGYLKDARGKGIVPGFAGTAGVGAPPKRNEKKTKGK